eukprot:TRINITY_DN15044_c0_g1_i2.p1 TRINITY_DN15044_c0_g1~~TRINITY_DN15044_c0_g1_i2.p1  ORF type:complete len:258 (-),score=40.11 TRINITY_DN15044_c0_g1_i2:71-730(-)
MSSVVRNAPPRSAPPTRPLPPVPGRAPPAPPPEDDPPPPPTLPPVGPRATAPVRSPIKFPLPPSSSSGLSVSTSGMMTAATAAKTSPAFKNQRPSLPPNQFSSVPRTNSVAVTTVAASRVMTTTPVKVESASITTTTPSTSTSTVGRGRPLAVVASSPPIKGATAPPSPYRAQSMINTKVSSIAALHEASASTSAPTTTTTQSKPTGAIARASGPAKLP